ncbi:hypothetical protein SAMN05192575_10187 [Nocardioides alpinus]|uniref:NPCBM/NEW2 domain-containing protein n=1 Tax=Nocardioides alpinus TaxID=748909 RepID=A0A1I0VA94_9ACTN|nr:hypothetical protein [Nocardioides alpinus]PKH37165.1 hypothetical protein CXG46_16860 [Nocardioides alpinus]SFA73319.1 hypothetical protein SAMN05192575_10187 [Nocardioides alpinus]
MNRIIALTASAALALSPLALATTSYAAPAKAAWTVTAKINETVAIGKETTLKVRGRVTPKAAGQKVVLQQRVGNKKSWKATGTAKVKNNGTYVLKDDPSTPGKRAYRVVKPASNGFAKGVSPTLDVEVYAWQKLAFRAAGPNANLLVGSGALIATDYYGNSLVTDLSGAASSIEYTLGRKCLELRATYALTDSSASGSSGAVVVSTDGAIRASHSLAVGTVVEDSVLDIEDAFRLKIDLSTTATPAAVAAVATPEVLCTR